MSVENRDLDLPIKVDVRSGTLSIISGTTILIGSGQSVIAGLRSGSIGVVSLTDDAGGTFAAIGIPNSDGASVGESLYTQAFTYGYDQITSSWNRIRTNKSGQGVLAVATSGADYVVSHDIGHTLTSAGIFRVSDSATQFPDAGGHKFEIKSLSGNVVVWIGGAGVASGVGYELKAEQTYNFTADNLDTLYGVGLASGYAISWIGMAV